MFALVLVVFAAPVPVPRVPEFELSGAYAGTWQDGKCEFRFFGDGRYEYQSGLIVFYGHWARDGDRVLLREYVRPSYCEYELVPRWDPRTRSWAAHAYCPSNLLYYRVVLRRKP